MTRASFYWYTPTSLTQLKEDIKKMANIRSAQKRARQAVVRTQRNASRMNRIRTAIRKVDEAISAGDYERAHKALQSAQPEIVRGSKKGLYHKKRASRKISRLSAQVKSLKA